MFKAMSLRSACIGVSCLVLSACTLPSDIGKGDGTQSASPGLSFNAYQFSDSEVNVQEEFYNGQFLGCMARPISSTAAIAVNQMVSGDTWIGVDEPNRKAPRQGVGIRVRVFAGHSYLSNGTYIYPVLTVKITHLPEVNGSFFVDGHHIDTTLFLSLLNKAAACAREVVSTMSSRQNS